MVVSLYLRTLVAGAGLSSDRNRLIVPRVNAPGSGPPQMVEGYIHVVHIIREVGEDNFGVNSSRKQ